jgi:hypothetical protein
MLLAMKRTLVALLVVTPGLALAQASISAGIRIDLPVVLPQLVVVSPGVQVVPEVEEEVFFVDRYYWVRRDRVWYRSRTHRGGWVVVPARAVPARIVEIPSGKYRRWVPPGHAKRIEHRRDRRHDHDRDHHRDRDHHDRDDGHGGRGRHKH